MIERGLRLASSNITVDQLLQGFLAIPAFLPLAFFVGYLAGWLTDLHGFRKQSFVSRALWSIPLSVSLSTIGFLLIGKLFSLEALVALQVICTLAWIGVLCFELIRSRRSGEKFRLGLKPFGGRAILFLAIWTVVLIFSLVDWQKGEKLQMSLTFMDHGERANWAESILRTGIPPVNSTYFYNHPSGLRYHYSWLVDCAAISRLSHIPIRSVMGAGCVWAMLCLVSVTGLYLKYFLKAGAQLRRQFVLAIGLFAVGGIQICVFAWNVLFEHVPLPGNTWSTAAQISDWVTFFLLSPHHVVSLVCCLFGFLLAWMAREGKRTAILMGFAFASAFGLSVYVSFAFFLVVVAWCVWQVITLRSWRPVGLFAAAGVFSSILLAPYVLQLAHTQSSQSKMSGGSPFEFSIRETIPPAGLLGTPLFRNLAQSHPRTALDIAHLVLIPPGYAATLGIYLLVLFAYLVPAWRGGESLSPARRTLVFFSLITIPITTFIRSSVIEFNDFGLHSALFLQFPMLLLLSDMLVGWSATGKTTESAPNDRTPENYGAPQVAPEWVRSLATLLIFVGAVTSFYRALTFRFLMPLAESVASADPLVAGLSHKAYIDYVGYGRLSSLIPDDAVVQFNPKFRSVFWKKVDLANVHRQIAMSQSELWCGSELGGDPTGCPAMTAAISPLFRGASADEALSTCRRYGIQYLVADIYDPAWKSRDGWVWKLPPIVGDPDFRVVDCR